MAADDGYDDSGEAERWGLGPALAGAAAVVLVNGALDFAWRVPLNGFVVASLMGLAVPGEGPALARGWTCRLATAAVVFAAAGLWLWLYPQARRCDRGSSLIGADASALGQALRWAPTYWLAWYELGRRAATVPGGMAVPVRTDAGHAAIAGPDALSAPGLGVGSRATPAATPRSVRDQRNAEDAAIGFLTSACACNPQDYRLHLALGEYALRAGEYATARSALLRAAELNPDLTPRVRRALSSGDPFTR